MIRLPLPFSMGRVTDFNPQKHYKETIEHPILEIGGSYGQIKYEIQLWLWSQVGDRYQTGRDAGEPYIDFENEQDLTMFLLRWS